MAFLTTETIRDKALDRYAEEVLLPLLGEVRIFAVALERSLSKLPRRFMERVKLAGVECWSVERRDGQTLGDCARAVAAGIKREAKGKAIQFIRDPRYETGQGFIRLSTGAAWPGVPVSVLAVFDVYKGKMRKRFDVQFVLHEKA